MMFGHILIRLALLSCLAFAAPAVGATGLTGTFTSIDGGALSLESWRGRPVLVVNTASRCGFTGQYDGLQRLYERYRDRGLVVLAVPSNDFRQELGTAQEVKEFCALNFALDLPMTDITQVRTRRASVLRGRSGRDRICTQLELQQDPDRTRRQRGRHLESRGRAGLTGDPGSGGSATGLSDRRRPPAGRGARKAPASSGGRAVSNAKFVLRGGARDGRPPMRCSRSSASVLT